MNDYDIVKNCIFLGSHISNKGDCMEELERLISVAKSAVTRVEGQGRH